MYKSFALNTPEYLKNYSNFLFSMFIEQNLLKVKLSVFLTRIPGDSDVKPNMSNHSLGQG